MGTELTTTNPTQGQLTQWRKPSLPAKLDALVSNKDSLEQMPVVGPQTAAILQAFFDHPEPPLADDDWIEKQIMALATKPMRKMASSEAQFTLEIWLKVLRGYPKSDLGYAFGRLLVEEKWFPDISDIVKRAEYKARRRAAKKHQAWKLVHKHKTDWREPIPESELVTPEAIAQITAEVDAEFEAKMKDMK